MNKSLLIRTEHQHRYMYSDTLRYFLYVPQKMATEIEREDTALADKDDYYVILLIDYLAQLCCSNYNVSHKGS